MKSIDVNLKGLTLSWVVQKPAEPAWVFPAMKSDIIYWEIRLKNIYRTRIAEIVQNLMSMVLSPMSDICTYKQAIAVLIRIIFLSVFSEENSTRKSECVSYC